MYLHKKCWQYLYCGSPCSLVAWYMEKYIEIKWILFFHLTANQLMPLFQKISWCVFARAVLWYETQSISLYIIKLCFSFYSPGKSRNGPLLDKSLLLHINNTQRTLWKYIQRALRKHPDNTIKEIQSCCKVKWREKHLVNK